MEAKVDIRKLQLLNDRIAQTIDALNQVRLSVYGIGAQGVMPGMGAMGLSHTGGFPGVNPMALGGYGAPQGGGQQSLGQVPFGYGTQGFGVPQTSFGGGFLHSGLQQMQAPQIRPELLWLYAQSQAAGIPGYGGLSHTDVIDQARASDRQVCDRDAQED